MKCLNCSHKNPESSLFCEECGHKLSHESNDSAKHHNITEELDDILFFPKKRGHWLKNTLLVLAVLLVGFICLMLIGIRYNASSQSTGTDVFQDTDTSTSLVNNLTIEDYKMEWIGQELYFEGTLKNNNPSAVSNVVVRLDFYKDKSLQELFDTRKVTISGAEGYGAFSFQIPVYAYPSSQFWWTNQIESTQ